VELRQAHSAGFGTLRDAHFATPAPTRPAAKSLAGAVDLDAVLRGAADPFVLLEVRMFVV
jgi:hypothetical protein